MIQTQMQKRTLRVLEFTKIREQLAGLAVTEMGRELCLALEPETNLEEVRAAQQETEEATVVIQYLGSSPLTAFSDVRSSLSLRKNGRSCGLNRDDFYAGLFFLEIFSCSCKRSACAHAGHKNVDGAVGGLKDFRACGVVVRLRV